MLDSIARISRHRPSTSGSSENTYEQMTFNQPIIPVVGSGSFPGQGDSAPAASPERCRRRPDERTMRAGRPAIPRVPGTMERPCLSIGGMDLLQWDCGGYYQKRRICRATAKAFVVRTMLSKLGRQMKSIEDQECLIQSKPYRRSAR